MSPMLAIAGFLGSISVLGSCIEGFLKTDNLIARAIQVAASFGWFIFVCRFAQKFWEAL